jgi:Fe2+ or Zn2+ uptake regulation protein
MSARANTQETLIIALELLRRIPRSRKVTAKELHSQLSSDGHNRDLRTIQRTLEMLSTKFDIDRDESSKPYGYRWSAKAVGISFQH